MPTIRQLSASLVNKIAAGEVIERPASVVKELLENSVDAGATRIDVTIEDGGGELIRVSDNGCGIAAEELPLAVASHATSKIASADDLFRVGTLGFRGEALASIAEVSRMTIRSRPTDAAAGAELEIVAGVLQPVAPCGCPTGTTMEVRNLFFNTPVRRKFLRTTQTEMGQIGEAFTRLALAHTSIHFTLRHGQRTLHDLPPTNDWLDRIERFFGRDVARNLLWVESRADDVRLFGYVGHPSQNRGNPRMQYVFLNGRSIRDRALQHALGEAYRGLLLTGRYPLAFLAIDMPPELVDVNVHPTKLEVRFQDGGKLYSQLLGTLRTKFLSSDLTTKVETGAASAEDPLDAQRVAQVRDELVDWAKGEVARWNTAGVGQIPAPRSQSEMPLDMSPTRPPFEMVRLPAGWRPTPGGASPAPEDASTSGDSATARRFDAALESTRHETQPRPVALQIHNRYLIAESAEGVVVIDQHALHERILYEQLRERVLGGALEMQNLLVPEPIDLSAAELAAVLDQRELLARLGVKVEPFGGDTVLLTSYPAMLANLSPLDVLRDLIEHLLSGGKAPDRRDLLDELLHTISCKAAIKAGDRLSQEEIAALLAQRDLVQDTHHCPHGRPTALVFSREELDRQFLRKG